MVVATVKQAASADTSNNERGASQPPGSDLSFTEALRAARQGTPSGSYYAPSGDDAQQRAFRLSVKLGERIAKNYPEVADLYRSQNPILTQAEIAQRLFADQYAKYPAVIEKAVGRAIRQLIPQDELREINAHRRKTQFQRTHGEGYFQSEAFSEHCRRAAARKNEIHPPAIDAMLAARGRVAWAKEEKKWAINLYYSPNYQLLPGAKGRADKNGLRPDHSKIAAELNRVFHNGEEVRSKNTVKSLLHEFKAGRLKLDS